jgi:Mrp family chromosome partitioning ATPase
MDILHDAQEWQKGLHHTSIDKLHLLPAGAARPGTLPLLDTPAFDAVIASCKETYDLILCLAPPILTSTDAAVLSGKVEATCLVLTRGVSRLDAIGKAKTALEAVQANVIGAILVGV